ncbi:MAG: NAD-dependent epimerase/dehydratase family protein [Acidobacteriaceae bacterium]|nr:NAD-dependent epimerase/dehydratase family protein [Acidobacteriaceae bacterium]MBV9779946.1 NAD-dependent epimerase/dehydratase family protein [Acidobacteriaceae bacterium]
MKLFITGVCGFVGSQLAASILEGLPSAEIFGIDNLLRPGSEGNRLELASKGIKFLHGDLRLRSDLEVIPACDWVIDAAANPSVLAGVDGRASPRQLGEHNLAGTLNLLEYCREKRAGLVLLSTSRVYSIRDLSALPVREQGQGFVLDSAQSLPRGVTEAGLSESFPVRQPVSLYGATKLASEIMALEYGATFEFPVWIDRCGVLAGAGQFGTAEQGIFSYWLHAHSARRPLRYIGFGGHGYQVRDAFHPADLADLVLTQMRNDPPEDPIYNAGGGASNAMSPAQLTHWCNERFGTHQPEADTRPRPYDIPWLVMDSSRASGDLGWRPKRSLCSILEEIADHVRSHPDWLARCGAT